MAAIVIGLALAVAIGAVRALRTDAGQRVYVAMSGLWPFAAGAVAAAVAVVALLIWRRPRLRTVLVAGAVLVAAGLAFGSAVRVEGHYGNLFPRLAWRWSPTAEEQFAAYEAGRDRSDGRNAEDGPAVDLSPSPHDYPGFLGANRDGIVRGVSLDPDWQARPPRELWRHPVGLGYGGFAVVGNLAVTQEQRGTQETVVAYDLRSGRERWADGNPARFSGSHGDGPRATPSVVAGRVYTMGATGLVTCREGATGRVIWQKAAFDEASRTAPSPVPAPKADESDSAQDPHSGPNLLWGMAGSPLVLADQVIVTPGGGPGRAVLALRSDDGAPAWSGGDDPAAYASPIAVELGGVRQILSFNGAGLRGFDAANGHPLWLHPWVTQGSQMVNVAQPLVVAPFGPPASNEGFVLISSGYGMGAALVRVTSEKGAWRTTEVWRTKHLKSKLSNFVVHGDYLYGLDEGVLACLDVRNGRRLWREGRYGHGQMLLVEDLLLIQAESGDVVLVETSHDRHRELAKLKALSDKTWNHPALAHGILVVRNEGEAAAFEVPLREPH